MEAIKGIISKLEISFTPSCGNKLSYYISARANSRHIGSELSERTIWYSEWDHDLLAVSDYVKVDPRTLQEYFRKRHEKYRVVWRVRNS